MIDEILIKPIDVFFMPEYGELYESIEGGTCEVFKYGRISYMYIMRPVPWLIDGVQYYDTTTPYGYGGPLSLDDVVSHESLSAFYKAWSDYCMTENIVAEFIRFHLFDNTALRDAFPGEVIHVNNNIVRNLNDSMDDMWMEFEHKVRKNVKKAQNSGLIVTIDETGEYLDTFFDIYYKTMERNNAKDFYFFGRAYFLSIIRTLPGQFMFFHVWKDNVIISTELVLCSDRYVYSFLGGTLNEYYSFRPNDLLKYEIIKWSKETGHQVFILGGGYDANDGIYNYKKAFAPESNVPFHIGRKIWNHDIYNAVVEKRNHFGKTKANEHFFPQYRA